MGVSAFKYFAKTLYGVDITSANGEKFSQSFSGTKAVNYKNLGISRWTAFKAKMNGVFGTSFSVNNVKWTQIHSTFSRVSGIFGKNQLSKMIQDVMGNSTNYSTASGRLAYIVSKGSGFSKGSNMSQFAQLRGGDLNAFNVKQPSTTSL